MRSALSTAHSNSSTLPHHTPSPTPGQITQTEQSQNHTPHGVNREAGVARSDSSVPPELRQAKSSTQPDRGQSRFPLASMPGGV